MSKCMLSLDDAKVYLTVSFIVNIPNSALLWDGDNWNKGPPRSRDGWLGTSYCLLGTCVISSISYSCTPGWNLTSSLNNLGCWWKDSTRLSFGVLVLLRYPCIVNCTLECPFGQLDLSPSVFLSMHPSGLLRPSLWNLVWSWMHQWILCDLEFCRSRRRILLRINGTALFDGSFQFKQYLPEGKRKCKGAKSLGSGRWMSWRQSCKVTWRKHNY